MFLAIGAINSQNNLLFWAFGLGVAGVIVSGMVSGAALMGLQVRRDVIGLSRVGQQVQTRYLVRNRNGYMPAMGLLLREKTEAVRSHKGRPEWLAHLDHAPARSTTLSTRSSAIAVKRGCFSLDQIILQSGFPFGLFRKSIVFRARDEVVIAPAKIGIKSSVFGNIRSRSATRAETLAAAVGAGGELAGVREYVPGDPRRQIAWKRSASRGQLIVKQTLEEKPTMCRVSIDSSLAGAELPARELALAAAVACIEEAVHRGMSGVLSIPWAGVRLEVPHGSHAVRRLLEAAARIELDPDPNGGEQAPEHVSILISAGRANEPASGAALIDVRTPERWTVDGEAAFPNLDRQAEGRGIGRVIRRGTRLFAGTGGRHGSA